MKDFYLVFIVLYYLLKALVVTPGDQHFYISFLNVGQGDAIVINIPNYGKVLIDAGSDYRSNYLISRSSIFPICQIRSIFITHYDNDHSGGLERVSRFCDSTILYDEVSYGDVFTIEDVYLYILNPLKGGYRREENDDSLVILVRRGNFEALITGDAGLGVLENLVAEINGLTFGKLDVYKVSHHGSLHNNSFDLLTGLKPEKCVISVGRNNYGHPAKPVIEDIAKSGCQLYRTDKDGAIMLYF